MKNETFNKIKAESNKRFKARLAEGKVPDFQASDIMEAITETVCNENGVTMEDFNIQQENLWIEHESLKEDPVVKYISGSGEVPQNALFEKFGFDSAEHIQKLEESGLIRSESQDERIFFKINNERK